LSVKHGPSLGPASGKIQHVIIIVKENHTFDNYFGTYPGADGMQMHRSPDPPPRDADHRHSARLTIKTTSVRQQFIEADIPAYFAYARQFTLCDKYFTDVAGPSTPNHLMLIAADSPFIDNPKPGDPSRLSTSLPVNIEKKGFTWSNYGGYAFKYLKGIKGTRPLPTSQFKADASQGRLPKVSWVYTYSQFDEDPPHASSSGTAGNVTVGMQWTVDQVNAIVKGGLWPKSTIFITWNDGGGWWDHVDLPDLEIWNH